MECGTCLLGEKVFDTAKYACVMRGVVAGCTVQEFAHQSSFIGPVQQRYSNKLIIVQLRCKLLHVLNINKWFPLLCM